MWTAIWVITKMLIVLLTHNLNLLILISIILQARAWAHQRVLFSHWHVWDREISRSRKKQIKLCWSSCLFMYYLMTDIWQQILYRYLWEETKFRTFSNAENQLPGRGPFKKYVRLALEFFLNFSAKPNIILKWSALKLCKKSVLNWILKSKNLNSLKILGRSNFQSRKFCKLQVFWVFNCD